MSPLPIGFKLSISLIVCSLIANSNAEFKCIVCDKSNAKCASDAANIESTSCPDATTKSCYTITDNDGNISRGCLTSAVTCTGKNCLQCDKAECNKDTYQTCKSCDSTSDPNCAQWSDENSVPSELCAVGINKCLVQIKDDKNTERRCAATKEEACAEGKVCEICETSNCNKGIYPTNRRLCYQCENSSKCLNPLKTTDDIKPLPCPLYDAEEKCFLWAASDTSMTRGCSSNAAGLTKCQENKEKCVQCDKDNCNVATFKVKQSIKCVQCEQSNSSCAWGFDASTAKDCTNELEYWQPEGCYTNKISSSAVERGCIYDTKLNCASTATCTTCNNANGCNNADAMDYTCYKCRSDNNPACVNEVKDDKGAGYNFERCRNPVTQENQGCYTERWNNIIIRSCLVDADSKTAKRCADTKYEECTLCLEPNCNKDKPPNAAGSTVLSIGLLVLSCMTWKLL